MTNKELVISVLRDFIVSWDENTKAYEEYKNSMPEDGVKTVKRTDMSIKDADGLKAVQLLAQIEGMFNDKGDTIDVKIVRPKFKIQ